MVAVGPNLFYTVTLPCTLWFMEKGKRGTSRADKVLFIDARHIYRQIDRAHRDWTDTQLRYISLLEETGGSAEQLAKRLRITARSVFKVLNAANANFHARQREALAVAARELDQKWSLTT